MILSLDAGIFPLQCPVYSYICVCVCESVYVGNNDAPGIACYDHLLFQEKFSF